MGESTEWPLVHNVNPDDCPVITKVEWPCVCMTVEQEGDYVVMRLNPASPRDDEFIGNQMADLVFDLIGLPPTIQQLNVTIA